MALKLHGIPMSSCTARVLLCLYEKGLQFELLPVDLAAGVHKQQPYLPLNVRKCPSLLLTLLDVRIKRKTTKKTLL